MTPEEKSLLESTHKMVEESNKILLSIQRTNRFSLAMKIGYWVLIIVLSFGAYHLIQPYITTMTGAYSAGSNTVNSVTDAANSLRDLLK